MVCLLMCVYGYREGERERGREGERERGREGERERGRRKDTLTKEGSPLQAAETPTKFSLFPSPCS